MENGGGGAAPTGCYKCGRPGHWSRDCPSNPNSNPTDNNPNTTSNDFKSSGGPSKPVTEKPKKVPRSRPKLTPELLLSNDGIGYVLRHFPRSFKYRGRGHEAEQVGATRRIRMCINDLRERIANGGDPTQLHEIPVEGDISNHEQEANDLDEPAFFQEDISLQNHDTDELPDVMLHEIFEKATEEPSQALHDKTVAVDTYTDPKEAQVNIASSSTEIMQISEEQKARIEANRLKALERAAAKAQSAQPV